jgi:hypothetical protein
MDAPGRDINASYTFFKKFGEGAFGVVRSQTNAI